MTRSAIPFLMFQGDAAEALSLYARVLPDFDIIQAPVSGPPGTAAPGRIRVCGLEVMVFDSPVKHAFGFTPAFSLFLTLASDVEVDRVADELAEQGKVLMPAGDYGFSRRFAWVDDRFGVSWQLNAA
jgi:predicted 3-demethylubiquinone-9 3-methyltransferase (glyoxalase superfamily)